MSVEQDNKAIVGRWFTNFWGKTCDLTVVDEIAAPEMLLHYSLHEPRRGREDIKAFMTDFREAFPDLNFWGAADLIAKGTAWSGAGKAAALIQDLRSAIFSWDHYRPQRVGRCISPVRLCCASRTVRSSKR